MTRAFSLTVALGLAASLISPAFAAGQDSMTPSFPLQNYTTSWLGNTYGGPDWVQRYTDDLFTAPDGTCYFATAWDEGGREYGIYHDGKVLGKAEFTHGWGNGGGAAVTANAKYMFIAQYLTPTGEKNAGVLSPPMGNIWYGIGRRHLDGSPAAFEGGRGLPPAATGGSFRELSTVPTGQSDPVVALASSDSQIFAASQSKVQILDPESMTVTGSWPLQGIKRMAYQKSTDSLWIERKLSPEGPATIARFSTAGKPQGGNLSLPPGTIPSGLAVTAADELFVGDTGASQQVLVFGDLTAKPKLIRRFGAPKGIYSGTPGETGPQKLSSPIGVGTDAAGNIYVASYHAGTVLESYTPTGERRWEIHSLEFADNADFDPASPAEIFTSDHHYRLQPGQPAGHDTNYAGYLIDSVGQPQDPRLHGMGPASMFVRRIQGQKFLFGLDMNASLLQIYRFTGQGELTRLCGLLSAAHRVKGWPETEPEKNGWLWRDNNGDGIVDKDEFDSAPEDGRTTSWSIDTKGDLWYGLYRNENGKVHFYIRHLPCLGLDANGSPKYSFATAIETAVPPPFDDGAAGASLCRIEYLPETDTMYLSGFDAAHKNTMRDWKTSGPVIWRFDNWTKTPTLRWCVPVPFESANAPNSQHRTPDAFSVAGKLLFNGCLKDGEIRVYNIDDGTYIGSLLPGPEVDRTCGWIDTMYGVRAHETAPGEYLVFAEEVWHEKVLMYRLHWP
jgi:hypothetical protein